METEAGMEMMQKQKQKKILIIDDDVKSVRILWIVRKIH